MKYMLIIDDNELENFRRDDDGLTLVVHDERSATRAFKLKPVIKPLVVFPHYMSVDEQSVYITTGHINAMIEYEQQQRHKELLDSIHNICDTIKRG